jgi:hypothetical protein
MERSVNNSIEIRNEQNKQRCTYLSKIMNVWENILTSAQELKDKSNSFNMNLLVKLNCITFFIKKY